jgi:hypothetical protein
MSFLSADVAVNYLDDIEKDNVVRNAFFNQIALLLTSGFSEKAVAEITELHSSIEESRKVFGQIRLVVHLKEKKIVFSGAEKSVLKRVARLFITEAKWLSVDPKMREIEMLRERGEMIVPKDYTLSEADAWVIDECTDQP